MRSQGLSEGRPCAVVGAGLYPELRRAVGIEGGWDVAIAVRPVTCVALASDMRRFGQ
jgi:hypothetical protein